MEFDTEKIGYETPFSTLLNQKDDALEDAKSSVEKELKQRYSVPEPELDKTLNSNLSPTIDAFRGENYYLSNFYPCTFYVDSIPYTNAEAAFQAQKCETKEQKLLFSKDGPYAEARVAKRAGGPKGDIALPEGWNQNRLEIMEKILEAKFSQNPDLLAKLKSTGSKELIEGNTWGDYYWGVYKGKGANHLGKLLMKLRERL